MLAGAKFKLYADQDCTNEIKLVADGTNGYRVATTGEKEVQYIETKANSALTIKGLKGTTTYYLKEIEAPKGYNELENAFAFTIASANISSNLNETSNKWVEETSTGGHHGLLRRWRRADGCGGGPAGDQEADGEQALNQTPKQKIS